MSAAVIERAVLDYEIYLRKLKKEQGTDPDGKNTKKHRRRIKELEKFFNSDWYELLAEMCGLNFDGSEVMSAVKERV